MGNYLHRANRCLGCWSCHFVEGCSCLPWKKVHIFKERRDSQKENEGMTSIPIQQDNADQTHTEEICYMLVNHGALRRPLGNPAEDYYENISCEARRPSRSVEGTEYSVLHVSSTPQTPAPPEDEYELLMPSRFSHHPPKQTPAAPFETQFSHLQ